MAINNVNATFTSFKRNDIESSLKNCVGPYSTSIILDGGNTLETTLLYTFTLTGLNNTKVQSITFSTLLLTQSGDLESAKDYSLVAYKNDIQVGNSIQATLPASSSVRTPIPIQFYTSTQDDENNSTKIQLQVNATNFNCCFGLLYISIQLYNYDKEIRIVFDGPSTSRSANNIICATHLLSKNAVNVSFSKDNTRNFDSQVDITEGRIYFRQNGIFVDGTQYGVTAPATEQKLGLVKLSASSFETETDPETGEVIGIIVPSELGVAATPQLVFNALATAKNYTDEQVAPISDAVDGIIATLNGINAPIDVKFINEQGEEEIIGEELTYSDDFEFKKDGDKKLYIKWIEI